jgi:prolyl oligopeptidase
MLYAPLDSFPKIKLKPFLICPASSNTIYNFIDNIDNKFLVLTDLYASTKRLMLYDPSQGVNHSQELVKPFKDVLVQATVAKDKIVCLYYLNGKYDVSIDDFAGKTLKVIHFPTGCTVSGFEMSNVKDETFCFVRSFYFPSVVYRLDMNDLSFALLDVTHIAFDQKNFETKYVTYISKDSVEIPMYITYKKGIKLDGNNPTVLYGYGGFGKIMAPFFNPSTIVWLENGGILAVPSIRGGGEEGTDWHKSAVKLKRYNAFNDFIYAAKYLIDSAYTNPNKLAIEGGSIGGLLVGVAMTQKPELFKAAIPNVGLMDMLRYQNFTIGSSWESEYGKSSDKESFENLYKYSPLQNIKQGIKYPATLAITADNDDRVSPLHTYKFIATLQEKGDNSVPYLLYVNKTAGHSGHEILEQKMHSEALRLAFLYDVLGVSSMGIW